jgi:putative DNA primase/helicase
VLGSEAEAQPENFQLLPADAFRDGLPNLASPVGQAAIEPLLEGAALIVLDNISTLASSARDNEAESWSSMQEWLLRLRRQGYSVLLVHHAGKSGNQRGTSRREDVLDTSILLKRPEDYVVMDGARFEIHFEKARGLHGDDVAPFEVKMEIRPDVGLQWSVRDIEVSRNARVLELLEQGMTLREVATETGISKSQVDRIKRAADVAKAGAA